MTASETAALDKVPFRVTHPQRIPSKRYYDQEFFELEREHLWPHVWQMACRLEEIPEVGDYVEYKNLDKSVIVVRTKTGVKAFHNACRHRGVQLVVERGNCKGAGFICPFHGWRWNMDGENTFIYGRRIFDEANLEAAELNLVPCRVELWGGCAFINHDDDAPSLLESLGPVTARMDARNAENLRVDGWWAIELPTNWKLAMEAFMEGFHVMRTHPQLFQAWTIDKAGYFGADAGGKLLPEASTGEYLEKTVTQLGRLHRGMAGMVLPDEIEIAEQLAREEWPEDVGAVGKLFDRRIKEEIFTQGRAKGLAVPDLNAVDAQHPFNAVEYMFPHYFLLPFYAGMSSYRVRPLTPETCLFELWSLTFLPEDDRRRVTEPTVLPHDSPEIPEIPRQDYSNLPRQQLGLHATGFEYMRLSSMMEGMISNYQRLIDGFLARLDAKLLAKAQNAVNSGFNRPIADIGF